MMKMNFATMMLLFLIVGTYPMAACADESYSWPDFQNRLRPGPSNSPVKAELPQDVDVVSIKPGTPETMAAYGGIWEGWMCRKKAVDVKVAITDVTADGATVTYVAAAESWRSQYAGGIFRRSTTASFKGDTLQGGLGRGIRLILGLRPDGYLNVKWESNRPGACFGILRKRNRGQTTGGTPSADTTSDNQLKALGRREVVKLLKNNTIDSVIEQGGARGTRYVAYLRDDGTATVLTDGNQRIAGSWRVNGKGYFCRTMPGLRPKNRERCHYVSKPSTGSGYVMQRPRDMEMTESFTVLPGNAKDL